MLKYNRKINFYIQLIFTKDKRIKAVSFSFNFTEIYVQRQICIKNVVLDS